MNIKCINASALYLATLRAIYFIYQQDHWLNKGNNFYGNHLLFQRLYENTLSDIDITAEKLVGLFDGKPIEYKLQTELLNKVLKSYDNSDIFENAIKIEKDFIKLSKDLYLLLNEEHYLTLGLDNMIMAISDNHEKNLYLLKQTMGKNEK